MPAPKLAWRCRVLDRDNLVTFWVEGRDRLRFSVEKGGLDASFVAAANRINQQMELALEGWKVRGGGGPREAKHARQYMTMQQPTGKLHVFRLSPQKVVPSSLLRDLRRMTGEERAPIARLATKVEIVLPADLTSQAQS